MTNPYRAMCAELVDDLEMSDWPSKLKETFRADITRARTLLAQPVAQEGGCSGCEGTPVASNSPCAVCGRIALTQPEPEEPTDDEIEEWADACSEAPLEEMDPEVHGWRRCFTAKEFSETIRAALARFGRPTPQPPADGEVAELVEWLQSMRDLAGEHNPDEQRRYTRAAELLEHPTPQPVAVAPLDKLDRLIAFDRDNPPPRPPMNDHLPDATKMVLSPAAQAVDRAIADRIQLLGEIAPSRQVAAAALQAAADQVVPPDPCGDDCCIDLSVGIRAELLAIAAELEAHAQ